tara:strand:- start:1921 stop:2100 length:180 start_codon:yes stop_codon:yes gene_type:complete
MYSDYLVIGFSAISGSLIYNGIGNLFLKDDVYESRKDLFNFGMLIGFSVGSGYVFWNKM